MAALFLVFLFLCTKVYGSAVNYKVPDFNKNNSLTKGWPEGFDKPEIYEKNSRYVLRAQKIGTKKVMKKSGWFGLFGKKQETIVPNNVMTDLQQFKQWDTIVVAKIKDGNMAESVMQAQWNGNRGGLFRTNKNWRYWSNDATDAAGFTHYGKDASRKAVNKAMQAAIQKIPQEQRVIAISDDAAGWQYVRMSGSNIQSRVKLDANGVEQPVTVNLARESYDDDFYDGYDHIDQENNEEFHEFNKEELQQLLQKLHEEERIERNEDKNAYYYDN